MKHCWTKTILGIILLFSLSAPFSAQANVSPPPTLSTLQPGGFLTIEQKLNINIVFIGFEDLDTPYIESFLPEGYRTILRYPAFYGYKEFLGNDFTFVYNFIDAQDSFEDDFFAWLIEQGTPGGRTEYQRLYNEQEFNILDVPDTVSVIDGPAVEEYLGTQGAAMLGDYTIFFINWYNRPDFQFHVYAKTNYVDPDTGYNFGETDAYGKMIAWGGSHGRTWFYDFSAGPEFWSGNYIVDPTDTVGYTIPPIWEYGNLDAYRPFDDMEGDMAKIIRFVGIDLLFTPSPLYKPLLSPPKLPNAINIDLNLFEGESGVSGLDWINTSFIKDQFDQLMPYKNFSVDLNDYALTGRLDNIFDCWVANLDSCFGKRLWNIAFGDLFLYAEDHLLQYLDGVADYEIPVFIFNVPREKMGDQWGLLGYADDNWRDGTQSFIFEFGSTDYRLQGYGLSWTAVHEAGHHIGLSHPHDGYDYELDTDFGPDGSTYFAWLGDESNTIMHYMVITPEFGKFNQDSMYRYEATGYINEANAILADIYANPQAGVATSLLVSADQSAALSLAAYDTMNYLSSVTYAKAAYDTVLQAADLLNVHIEPQAWQADYKAHGQKKFLDPIRYPDQ